MSLLKSNYHKNKILQFPKKWKNVDFLIKLEPIKIRQEKRISPTVNWCKNAGSLCRWVFCPGRYTFVGDKSKSLNWKIRLKSFASSLEDFACYFCYWAISRANRMMEWAKWYRFFPNIELSNLKGATYVKQKQKEQSYRIWWWAAP